MMTLILIMGAFVAGAAVGGIYLPIMREKIKNAL